MTGIELIAKERQEQIEKHGRTVEHDVEQNEDYQLSTASANLSNPFPELGSYARTAPTGWDKDLWFKMINKPYKQRLVIAAALLAAEIDRLNFEKGE